ncbi:hypothetical protein JTE90_020564 [Oedothorax gibbosus]|uniref:Uncharacterized protein n=1 Tax=Oedothorax gibbosus TaxID=931172 RepID=A0AAV6VVY8_9ARAC|nr:hypothetical protein JTE90_020564 [Oedothorax gibbosus]
MKHMFPRGGVVSIFQHLTDADATSTAIARLPLADVSAHLGVFRTLLDIAVGRGPRVSASLSRAYPRLPGLTSRSPDLHLTDRTTFPRVYKDVEFGKHHELQHLRYWAEELFLDQRSSYF